MAKLMAKLMAKVNPASKFNPAASKFNPANPRHVAAKLAKGKKKFARECARLATCKERITRENKLDFVGMNFPTRRAAKGGAKSARFFRENPKVLWENLPTKAYRAAGLVA